MTELSSITEARRKALDVYVSEMGLAIQRMQNAHNAYTNRMQQLARHDQLGAPGAPVFRGMGRPSLFSQEEEERYICEPYWESYKRGAPISIRRLAAQLGCNRATVDRALKRYAKRYPKLVAQLRETTCHGVAKQIFAGASRPAPDYSVIPVEARRMRAPAPLKPDTTWDDDIPKETPEQRAETMARIRAESAPKKRSLEDMAFDDAELYGDTHADR